MRKAVVLLALLTLTGLAAGCARPPASGLSARMVLSSRTVTAGGQLTGRVTVDNRTGHILRIHGCGDLVDVTLSSRHYHPALTAPSCAGLLAVPPGRTAYPVRVLASYLSCRAGHAGGGLPRCGPRHRAPPLPPGTYQASLYAVNGFVPAPEPIPVRVTR
jgi:hypothetical protein